MSHVDSLVEFFNDKSNFDPKAFIEFEFKFVLVNENYEIYKNCFKYFKSICKEMQIRQTINFITSISKNKNKNNSSVIENSSSIKELYFNDGIQDKSKLHYYTKTSLHTPVYLHSNCKTFKLKLGISSEMDILKPTTVEVYDFIRFKQRFRFVIKDWNIDFTFVKTSNTKDINIIKKIKTTLFSSDLNETNIFDDKTWIWEYADSIEMEFEFTSKTIKKDSIKEIADIAAKASAETSCEIDINFQNAVDQQLKIPIPITLKKFIKTICEIVDCRKDLVFNNTINTKVTLKQLLPKAIELNKSVYFDTVLPNIDNFYITDKADGKRVLLHIDKMIGVYDNTYYVLKENTYVDIKETILECELIGEIFYAFDVLKYDGVNINETFVNRLKVLQKLNNKIPFLAIKHFLKLEKNTYQIDISNFYSTILYNKEKYPYETDGIMFTSADDIYKFTKFFKWKPIEHTTIDFVAKKFPTKFIKNLSFIPNKPSYEADLYILFVGISDNEFNKFNIEKIQEYDIMFPDARQRYFPVQFMPSFKPLAYFYWHKVGEQDINAKVIEMHYNVSKEEWKLVRIREDRTEDLNSGVYYGNNYKVAEIIWNNYFNPLTMKDLCMSIKDMGEEFYFKVHESKEHEDTRKYNNIIKRYILKNSLKNIASDEWVVDLGCGKGQDLSKYISNTAVENVLMIDNNLNNLTTVVERKYSNKSNQINKTGIYTLDLDLNTDYKTSLAKIKTFVPFITPTKTKVVVCNFAIHYFIKNKVDTNNFVSLVCNLLKTKNGLFLYTCLDGKKIFDLLSKSPNKQWGDGKKYLIRAVNWTKSKEFVGGEEIEILLPFSGGKLYKEFLVNAEIIRKQFIKNKFKAISSNTFGEVYKNKDFSEVVNNRAVHGIINSFNEMDKIYIDIICYSLFQII
jgi:hypothetical protein